MDNDLVKLEGITAQGNRKPSLQVDFVELTPEQSIDISSSWACESFQPRRYPHLTDHIFRDVYVFGPPDAEQKALLEKMLPQLTPANLGFGASPGPNMTGVQGTSLSPRKNTKITTPVAASPSKQPNSSATEERAKERTWKAIIDGLKVTDGTKGDSLLVGCRTS